MRSDVDTSRAWIRRGLAHVLAVATTAWLEAAVGAGSDIVASNEASSAGLGILLALSLRWAPWTAGASALGWGVAWFWSLLPEPWRHRLALRGHRLRTLLALLLVTGSGALLFDAVHVRLREAFPSTARIALFLLVAVLLAAAVPTARALARALEATARRLDPRLGRRDAPWWFLLLVVVIGVALRLGYAERDFFSALPWHTTLLLASSGALGALVRYVVSTSRGRWLAPIGGLVAVVTVGIAWSTPSVPASVRSRWLRTAPLSRWLPQPGARAVKLATPAGAEACMPGEPLSPAGSLGKAGNEAPDIVWITVDALRWDHTSLAEKPRARLTPKLLQHARRAAVFARAYTPAPSTRQAFRSLFTGAIPGRVAAPPTPGKRWALSIPDGQPTVAAHLQAAGYETVALVSDRGAFPRRFGGLQGFREIDETPASYRRRHRHSAGYVVSRIIGRLARHPALTGPPRFVWTHLMEPHYRYEFGPELPGSPHMPERRRYRHAIRYVDQQLDRLLDFLTTGERGRRTWVFLTADHGEQFGEHGFRRHGHSVYEEEAHVPLLVWGPGVKARRIDAPVTTLDLYSTILQAAGLRAPRGVCARSLMDVLTAGTPPHGDGVYIAALPDRAQSSFVLGWVEGRHKLVVHPRDGSRMIFDLTRDPGEKQDVASSETERLEKMTVHLRRFLAERGLRPEQLGLTKHGSGS